uniref:Uncharacterized protein n=1 Tax=Neogobius melanostomus TaxID=47308 RepID=A0A8C6USI1_9GOBI
MVNEESLDPKSASESGRIVALSEEDRTILAKSVNSSYREFIQGATMKFTGALLWLWMLTDLFSSSTQDESVPQNCSSKGDFTELSQLLERAVLCEKSGSGLSPQETAQVLSSISTLAQRLHAHQLTECEGAKPSKCPPAEAPENGGLFCVTISDRRFCKPLCHHGYDFGFLRRSRAYEECSNQTQYKWNTQYVGGNRLAVCNDSIAS